MFLPHIVCIQEELLSVFAIRSLISGINSIELNVRTYFHPADYMPTTHVILVSMQSWSSRISHRLLSQYFPGKLQGFVLPIHDHYSQTPQS
jgi:hypothetical protein